MPKMKEENQGNDKICIAIPIKTINKRLPGKTFKEINGKPLYSYLFETLKKLKPKFIDEVYIYSSDETILKIANKWGFVPLKQPPEYDIDTSVTGDFLISKLRHHLSDFDIIGWFHITSPFLSERTIKRAISVIKKNQKLDSLFGVVPRFNRFWFDNEPINQNPKKLLRTQDLKPVYEEADFYFFRRTSFEKYGKRVCGKFATLEVNKIEAVDIDDLVDLTIARALINEGLVEIMIR